MRQSYGNKSKIQHLCTNISLSISSTGHIAALNILSQNCGLKNLPYMSTQFFNGVFNCAGKQTIVLVKNSVMDESM